MRISCSGCQDDVGDIDACPSARNPQNPDLTKIRTVQLLNPNSSQSPNPKPLNPKSRRHDAHWEVSGQLAGMEVEESLSAPGTSTVIRAQGSGFRV